MDATVEQHLKEARSLRDLGFYNDSSRHFDKALSKQPENIPLILEAASMKMSQGLVGDCHAMISALESRIDRGSPDLDPIHLAMFDMLYALSTFTITVKFKEPLRRALDVYTKYGLDRPVEWFDKSMVIVAGAYHCLLALAKQMCYQHDTPLPSFSAEFQSSLAHYLLSEKRYGDAIKIAILSNFSGESSDNMAMLEAILAEEGLSDLQRAEVLWEHGDRMRLTDGGDGWRESLITAAELYSKEGHASGALDIRIDLMQHRRHERTAVEDTAELWRIKGIFESVGNWASVNRCLVAIVNINTQDMSVPPESLQAKVEEEWVRATDICSNNSVAASSSVVKILEWQSTKSKAAKGLDYLEHFYKKIADCDAPVIISFVLTTLHDTYKRIGDTAKAEECISRRSEVLPRSLVAILGIDPFEAALNAATEAADTEIELKSLRDELQKVRVIIRRSPDLQGRVTEVQRLSNICHTYLLQYGFRGYDQLERLVDCIASVIEEECKNLDSRQSTIWRAGVLQSRALLVQIKSNSSKDVDELLRLTTESTTYYQRAVDLFEASGFLQDMHAESAMVKLANNRRLLWQLKGYPAESDDFSAAATLYAGAVGSGNIDGRQMTCLSLLRHWFEGYLAKVQVDATAFQPSSPYEMAVKWANEADRLAGIQRNDLSALPRERAVLAKQMLSKRDPKQDFHPIAMELHDSMDDDLGTWNWLQKSKARSISDMLALGINIPRALKNLLESDPELVGMCEAEQKLIQERDTAPGDQLFYLRMKLDSHRAEMKKQPLLKQLLGYREGQPTSLERLQDISPRSSSESTRSIFFVDWLVFGGQCCAFIASSTGIASFALGVTSAAISEWKAKYLGDGSSASHPLDSLDVEPLQKLSKLIRPVLDRTSAGDILVFCPADVLHGVPLHAATLAEDSKTSLLERNPVVYTASMTTFEQCVAKEAERQRLNRQISRSYIAVYERTETGPLNDAQKSLRDDIYTMVRKVAARRQPCSAAFGNEVKREGLVSAFEADCMYFFGHCVSSAANMLLQGLVLDDPTEREPISESAVSGQQEDIHQVFTASDMFAIDIKTSCLTLIACGSANEGHSQGEEPLGIISALLCAGATSVIGTMWKVQVGTAGIFTNVLDINLNKSEKSGNVVDLAVAVQQSVLRLKARREGQTDRAYHWASFVLHGSWFMSKRVPASCT